MDLEVSPLCTFIRRHFDSHPVLVGLAPACIGESSAFPSPLPSIGILQGPCIRPSSVLPVFHSRGAGIPEFG